jgi:hypothetical protein
MLKAEKTPQQIIENLYVRTLSRKPTNQEMQKLLAAVNEAKDKRQALEDVFWSLMNSKEFLFNH